MGGRPGDGVFLDLSLIGLGALLVVGKSLLIRPGMHTKGLDDSLCDEILVGDELNDREGVYRRSFAFG